MEHGRRLLGALEMAGAALFAAGLALRSAHRHLRSPHRAPLIALKGKLVLMLGADQHLGYELALQLFNKGSRLVCVGSSTLPPLNLPPNTLYIYCSSYEPSQLARVAKRIATDVGEVDIVIWAGGDMKTAKTPLEQIVNIVNTDLMEHFHVVSQFVPMLAKRSGHFVTIEHSRMSGGSFTDSGIAITALADTITEQMVAVGGMVHMTRATHRPARPGDQEDLGESAAVILRAVELGDPTVTLPSAKQHIKNTLRHLFGEIRHLWNQTVLRQWKLAT